MDKKPVILVLLAHYLPGYKCGGPVRTIANLVEHLGDEFDFKIITSDRDMLETNPFPDVQTDEWNTVGKAAVFYSSPEQLSFSRLASLVSETPHDILYINSFFSPRFSIFPLLARNFGMIPQKPVVLAPRGEFSSGALAIKKLKKHFFLSVAKLLRLHRNFTWQASSEYEAEDISSTMGNLPLKIMVAPDLLPKETPALFKLDPAVGNSAKVLRIVFLSRISPMKNLDYAIDVLKRVTIPVEFNIYGVIDDQPYWESCKEKMRNMPENIKMSYKEAIEHEHVYEEIRKHDLFFLPTRGENFGHAIFEALAAGVPALISDQTPWRDLEENGAGWVRPLENLSSFVDVIEKLGKKDSPQREPQRSSARHYAQRRSNDGEIINASRVVFIETIKY